MSENKLLAATEQKIEAGLTPQTRDAYEKILVAAMKVSLKDGQAGILAGLGKSQDPLKDVAVGAINVVMLLRKQSPAMPPQALVPAAMTLMLNGLDFMDRSGIEKIDVPQIDKATRHFTNHLLKVFNVTPQMLQQMAGQVNGVMKDPVAMEKIARRTGQVRDPGASTSSGIIPDAPVPEVV